MTKVKAVRTLKREDKSKSNAWQQRAETAREGVAYLGRCGVTRTAAGTRVRARMKPREKLMRAVQPSSTARYSTATSFRTLQPCSVPSPVRSL